MSYTVIDSPILSADEFLVHPTARDHAELVRGRIRMMSPASLMHGIVSMAIARLLSNFVHQHKLGVCVPDNTGFALPNLVNTVRVPDVSFIRASNLPIALSHGFARIAPDLVVEVLSPSESASDLAEKLGDYRVAGTELVWVVDPVVLTVRIIDWKNADTLLSVGDTLTGFSVLPGFACAVSELFEGLAPPK